MEIIEIDGKKDLIFCLVGEQSILKELARVGLKSLNFMAEDDIKKIIIIRSKKEGKESG